MLDWASAPAGTESFALILRDPDAPGGDFVHWMVANIPAATTQLPQGWDPSSVTGVVSGLNDFGVTFYAGPCPPPADSPHTYQFLIYAMDHTLPLSEGFSLGELEAAIASYGLDSGLLTGTYGRSTQTETPTTEPTATPEATATPTTEPTATAEPTAMPTTEPTATATTPPTATPTMEPTSTTAPTQPPPGPPDSGAGLEPQTPGSSSSLPWALLLLGGVAITALSGALGLRRKVRQ